MLIIRGVKVMVLMCLSHLQMVAGNAAAAAYNAADNQVKCFCDKATCPGALVCMGKWCLIGVRNEDGNGRLDQICGWDDAERPVDCAQSWSKWSEVCACEQDLCNTFAYLRSNMDTRSLGGHSSDPRSQNDQQEIYKEKEETLSFFDSPYPLDKRRQSNRGWYQGNNLIILLVIIPLCVGGFVVCLVFLNYHCKMS